MWGKLDSKFLEEVSKSISSVIFCMGIWVAWLIGMLMLYLAGDKGIVGILLGFIELYEDS